MTALLNAMLKLCVENWVLMHSMFTWIMVQEWNITPTLCLEFGPGLNRYNA